MHPTRTIGLRQVDDMIGDQKEFSSANDTAARYGQLFILQLFQTVDEPGGLKPQDPTEAAPARHFLYGEANDLRFTGQLRAAM
jgi:hypothetical protein